jgi:hypothetical protein
LLAEKDNYLLYNKDVKTIIERVRQAAEKIGKGG